VILEPLGAEDAVPWAEIDKLGDQPFMPEGREQPAMPSSSKTQSTNARGAFLWLIELTKTIRCAALPPERLSQLGEDGRPAEGNGGIRRGRRGPSSSAKAFEPSVSIFDACILYPFHLRNVVIQAPVDRVVEARWTDEIHNE